MTTTTKPPGSNKFKPGQSGNPNGRPPKAATLERAVERLMTESDIVFDGDPLAYMAKHAEFQSRAGNHSNALAIVEKIMPYINPRMSQVAAQGEDNEIVIRFEDPETPKE
jgi:hypothetical protein